MVIQSLRSTGPPTHRLTEHLSGLLGSYLGNSLYNVTTVCIEPKYVAALMSPCLLQRSQLWKHVPLSSVVLSDQFYRQKDGHEFVLSTFVLLMLGSVIFI
jgi:hypothetical protein